MTTTPQAARATPEPSAAAPVPMRILRHGGYEVRTQLGNGEQLVISLVLPLLALFALTWLDVLDSLGAPRIDIAAPGVLGLSVISVAFTGQGIQTGFDRQYGVLRSLATTPLGRGGLIAGKAVAVVCVLAVVGAVIGLVAAALGWKPVAAGWLPAVLLMLLGAVCFTSLGLLIAGTLRPQATLAVTNLLWVLMAAAGGVLMSAHRLPGALGGFVSALPSAALGDGLREAFLHGAWDPNAFAVLGVWALVSTAAAVRWFRWD